MGGATPFFAGILLCILLVIGTVAWQEWLYPRIYEVRRKRRYLAAYQAQLHADSPTAGDEQQAA